MALVAVHRSPSNSNSSSTISISDNDDEPDSDLKRVCECFFAIKGAALVLPHSTDPRPIKKHPVVGELQQHLQSIFFMLRSQDTITLAVRLESMYENHIRYMVLVSTMGVTDSEETIILGVDLQNSQCSVGLVLPIWRDVDISMDGDGGFGVHINSRSYIFKPVSIQAMWSAIQCLYKSCQTARSKNYFPGGLNLTWSGYYSSLPMSSQKCCYEWNLLPDTLIHISEHMTYHEGFVDGGHYCPSERELTERYIWLKLKEIMMHVDLDNITCKTLRTRLEAEMGRDLREYRSTIDEQALTILGQMDSASKIFDFLYLGSEWNASNYEELNKLGIRYVLNVTKEIDNFFPRDFTYYNVRVYDSDFEDLLKHWDETNRFISKAKEIGSKVLVHCKMGVSRSASTVIAFVMKEKNWSLEQAYKYVKEQRKIINPIPGFMDQLEEYQGILDASKHRHNSLWRSKSESSLSTCESLENIHSHDVFSSSEDLPVSLRRRSWSPDKDTADSLLGPSDPTSSCYAGEIYLPNPSPTGRDSGHFADEERESTSSGDDCSEIHIPVPTLPFGPGKGQGSSPLSFSVPDRSGLDRAEGGQDLARVMDLESSKKSRRKSREKGGKRSLVKEENRQDQESLIPVKSREEEKDGGENEQLLNTNNNSASGLELAGRMGEAAGTKASGEEEAVPVDVRERISNIEYQISRLDSTGSPEKSHLDSPLLEDLPLDTVRKQKERLEQKIKNSLPGTPESGVDKTLNVPMQPGEEGEVGTDGGIGGQTSAQVTDGSVFVTQGESLVKVENENDISGDAAARDSVLGVMSRDISAIKGELFQQEKEGSSDLPPPQYSSPSLSKLEPGSVQRSKEKFQSWQTKGWKSPALGEDPLSKLERLKDVRVQEETVSENREDGVPEGAAIGDSTSKRITSDTDTPSPQDKASCQSEVTVEREVTPEGEVQVTSISGRVEGDPSVHSQVSLPMEGGVSCTPSSSEEVKTPGKQEKQENISEPLPTLPTEETEQVSPDTPANVVMVTAMGEEIPLQPGTVRRQTKDFEQLHWESREKPRQTAESVGAPGVSDSTIQVCDVGSETVEHGKDVETSTYSKDDESSGTFDRVDPSSEGVDTGVSDAPPEMTNVGEGLSEKNWVVPEAGVAMATPQGVKSSEVVEESSSVTEENAGIHGETGEMVSPEAGGENSSSREQTGWKTGSVKKHTKELEKLSAASTASTSGQSKTATGSRSTNEQEASLTSDQLEEIRDLGKIVLCKENSQEDEDIIKDEDEATKQDDSPSADVEEADSQKEEKVAEGDFVNVLERVRKIELKRCSSIASMSSEKVARKYRKRTSPDRETSPSVDKKELAVIIVERDNSVPVSHDKLHVSVVKKVNTECLNSEAELHTEYDQTRSETVKEFAEEAHSLRREEEGQSKEGEATSQSNTSAPSILRQVGPRGRRTHDPLQPLTRLRQSSGKHPFYSTM